MVRPVALLALALVVACLVLIAVPLPVDGVADRYSPTETPTGTPTASDLGLQWTAALDTSRGVSFTAVETTGDGGVIAGGGVEVSKYQSRSMLMRVAPNGETEWVRTREFSPKTNTSFSSKAVTHLDEDIVVGGILKNTSSSSTNEGLVYRSDDEGNITWERRYDQRTILRVKDIVAAPDGGFLLVGPTRKRHPDSNLSQTRAAVVKIDSEGSVEWNRTFGDRNRSATYTANSAVTSGDGGYVFAGLFSETATPGGITQYSAAWLVKLEDDGSVEWNRTYGNSTTERKEAKHVVRMDDGGYVFLGRSYIKPWMVGVDREGREQWNRSFDAQGNPQSKMLDRTRDDTLVTVWGIDQPKYGVSNLSVTHLTRNGMTLGRWVVERPRGMYSQGMTVSDDDEVIVAERFGGSFMNATTNRGGEVIKTDPLPDPDRTRPDTATPTQPPSPTPRATPTVTEPSPTTRTPTRGDSSGFGLAAALVALAGVVLLTRR